jgi:MGT family glycosyltransferase
MPVRKHSVLFVVRDGGGTASVELTVAAKLRERGHVVRLFGPPEVADRCSARGFELQQLGWPPGTDTTTLMSQMVSAGPAWAEQIRPYLGQVDGVVADCAWFGPLAAARAAGIPTVGLMSTIYVADDPAFARNASILDSVNGVRSSLGLTNVGSLADQMLDADRLLLLTGRAFELPSVRPPAQVRYVGPQLPDASAVDRVHVQLPAGTDPLVLISLSTTDMDQLGLLQRIIDALAGLPVRGLVTIGPVDGGRLRLPGNVAVERFVPHDQVLPDVSLVVTHAGHGTVMASIAAGVPLVCIPMGRDQPAVTDRVTHHGLGVSVDPTTDVAGLRRAVRRVLDDAAYRCTTQRMAAEFEPRSLVVTEIEQAFAERSAERRRRRPRSQRCPSRTATPP